MTDLGDGGVDGGSRSDWDSATSLSAVTAAPNAFGLAVDRYRIPSARWVDKTERALKGSDDRQTGADIGRRQACRDMNARRAT